MRSLVRLVLLLGLPSVIACGGSSTPTTPTPVVTTVQLTSSTTDYYLGQTYTFSAGGATISSWSSDAPSVASVNSAGQVTVVGVGDATIVATGPTAHGQQRITTFPNFQGTWSGSYQIQSCTDTGDFHTLGTCGRLNGEVLPIILNLSQDKQQVSGSIALGTLVSDNFTAGTSGINVSILTSMHNGGNTFAEAFKLTQQNNSALTGTIGYIWTNPIIGGETNVTGVLISITRNSGTGHSLMPTMQPRGDRPDDIIRALSQR